MTSLKIAFGPQGLKVYCDEGGKETLWGVAARGLTARQTPEGHELTVEFADGRVLDLSAEGVRAARAAHGQDGLSPVQRGIADLFSRA